MYAMRVFGIKSQSSGFQNFAWKFLKAEKLEIEFIVVESNILLRRKECKHRGGIFYAPERTFMHLTDSC